MNLLSHQPFKIGVNYWPESSAIKMWSNWKPQEIAKDFMQMSEAGLDLVRFFIFTPDFVKKGRVEGEQIAHYIELLNALRTANLASLPTLFVGHMSGQNFRVEGWDDKTFLSDPQVLKQQKSFIKAIIDASADSENIAGWCLSNEMPNEFPGKNAAEVTTWITAICTYIRSLDSRPVVVGDGVWSPEITGIGGQNNLEPSSNYQLRDIAPQQDILGVHFYPRYDDFWPQAYTSGFRLLMAKSWKQEVFLEEFGHSIAMGSEENQALYYREVLFSALQAGATAGMNWCWSDFDQPELRPYLHNNFEMRFGLRRSDGTFRPALQEMLSIKKLSEELLTEGWELAPRDSHLIIPATFFHALPFDWDRNTDEKYELYLHSYGALASSGALPMCIHEPGVEHRAQDHDIHYTHNASFGETPTVMWLPALKRISAPFWNQILKQVSEGSQLYASFANDHWITDLDETLGVKSNLRFGLPDFYPEQVITLSSPNQWGPFGDSKIELELDVIMDTRMLSYLPAEVLSAETLLEDSAGRPILIRKNRGAGNIYFSLLPFEVLMTLSCDMQVRTLLAMIYTGIREENHLPGSSSITAGGEFLRFNRGNDTKEYLFNHTWEQRAFDVRLKNDKKTIKNFRVELPPKSFCQVVDTDQA